MKLPSILTACASVLLVATPASTPAMTSASPPVSQSTAAELARTAEPLELVIPTLVEQARVAVVAIPALHDDAKQLEDKNPGLFASVWEDIKPEVQKYYEADEPKYWAELEKLYTSRLTESEAQAWLRFYRSPTGQKLTGALAGGFDQSEILARAAKNPSSRITSKQMDRATYASKLKALDKLGPEDQKELEALKKSLDPAKFDLLTADLRKLKLAWINKQDAESQERLRSLMYSAIERHMADRSIDTQK